MKTLCIISIIDTISQTDGRFGNTFNRILIFIFIENNKNYNKNPMNSPEMHFLFSSELNLMA